jgi:SPX domain protein involved in polyphosphate accumulation
MNTAAQPCIYSGSTLFEARAEHVFFLDDEEARAFIDCVAAHLDVDTFHRHELEWSEPPAHYVTTLYFDSDTQDIARACECGKDGIRLRAREYCDQLTKQVVRREPLLWLEVKTRTGARTRKIRFAIPSDEVQTVLCDGVISEQLHFQNPAWQSRAWGKSAEAVLHEIAQLCMHTGPLKPDCMARYRRQAWQDACETLRVTLDTELAFYRPHWSGTSLADAIAEPPSARLSHGLVEIKTRGEQPKWLRDLIVAVGLEPAFEGEHVFSKFVAASHAVHRLDDCPWR